MPERVRHQKRGTEYEVLTRHATLQAAEPVQEGMSLVVYRGADGRTWVRPRHEFDDGRFLLVVTASQSPVDEVDALKTENGLLRGYLRAFVRATYQHPNDCYGKTPAQDAEGMHRVNPGVAYSFGLRELEGPDPVITGGQVLRAMELLGEVPEVTEAERAENLRARAMLSSLRLDLDAAIKALGPDEEGFTAADMLSALAHAMTGTAGEKRALNRKAAADHVLGDLQRARAAISEELKGDKAAEARATGNFSNVTAAELVAEGGR